MSVQVPSFSLDVTATPDVSSSPSQGTADWPMELTHLRGWKLSFSCNNLNVANKAPPSALASSQPVAMECSVHSCAVACHQQNSAVAVVHAGLKRAALGIQIQQQTQQIQAPVIDVHVGLDVTLPQLSVQQDGLAALSSALAAAMAYAGVLAPPPPPPPTALGEPQRRPRQTPPGHPPGVERETNASSVAAADPLCVGPSPLVGNGLPAGPRLAAVPRPPAVPPRSVPVQTPCLAMRVRANLLGGLSLTLAGGASSPSQAISLQSAVLEFCSDPAVKGHHTGVLAPMLPVHPSTSSPDDDLGRGVAESVDCELPSLTDQRPQSSDVVPQPLTTQGGPVSSEVVDQRPSEVDQRPHGPSAVSDSPKESDQPAGDALLDERPSTASRDHRPTGPAAAEPGLLATPEAVGLDLSASSEAAAPDSRDICKRVSQQYVQSFQLDLGSLLLTTSLPSANLRADHRALGGPPPPLRAPAHHTVLRLQQLSVSHSSVLSRTSVEPSAGPTSSRGPPLADEPDGPDELDDPPAAASEGGTVVGAQVAVVVRQASVDLQPRTATPSVDALAQVVRQALVAFPTTPTDGSSSAGRPGGARRATPVSLIDVQLLSIEVLVGHELQVRLKSWGSIFGTRTPFRTIRQRCCRLPLLSSRSCPAECPF